METEFILYVSDQSQSSKFYQKLLQMEPCLSVPGITEFKLNDCTKLGLMPENGIEKIICPAMPNPNKGNGIPRCELYLTVDNANEYLMRGIGLGGRIVSKVKLRDWGDRVAYLADVDGHVVAFAEKKSIE